MNHAEVQMEAKKRGLGGVEFEYRTALNTGRQFEVRYVFIEGERALFCKSSRPVPMMISISAMTSPGGNNMGDSGIWTVKTTLTPDQDQEVSDTLNSHCSEIAISDAEDGLEMMQCVFKDGTPLRTVLIAGGLDGAKSEGTGCGTDIRSVFSKLKSGKYCRNVRKWAKKHPKAWAHLLSVQDSIHTEFIYPTADFACFLVGPVEDCIAELERVHWENPNPRYTLLALHERGDKILWEAEAVEKALSGEKAHLWDEEGRVWELWSGGPGRVAFREITQDKGVIQFDGPESSISAEDARARWHISMPKGFGT